MLSAGNGETMPKVGEFCSSNVARFLLGTLIVLILLALVFFFFFYASGRRSIERSPGPNSRVIYRYSQPAYLQTVACKTVS